MSELFRPASSHPRQDWSVVPLKARRSDKAEDYSLARYHPLAGECQGCHPPVALPSLNETCHWLVGWVCTTLFTGSGLEWMTEEVRGVSGVGKIGKGLSDCVRAHDTVIRDVSREPGGIGLKGFGTLHRARRPFSESHDGILQLPIPSQLRRSSSACRVITDGRIHIRKYREGHTTTLIESFSPRFVFLRSCL